ncbi:MAG: ribbon-helix-helix domain-containing protein [Acidimicrobiaceae bacterium]|nr:ribbon-helix-helix domain-containing protein [Acidimicrobiaceae bacterium]
MRRIQLYIEPDIDDALSAAAARRGVSRSAVVREAVRRALHGDGDVLAADPLDALVGSVDVAPDDDLDAVIYDIES